MRMQTKLEADIIIDFGNSGTRVILLCKGVGYRYNMSNRFSEPESHLELPGQIPKAYQNNATVVFEVGTPMVNGEWTEREHKATSLTPTGLSSKLSQVTTEFTLHLAIIRAIRILASRAENLSALDLVFNISVLLPPSQYDTDEADLIAKIKEINTVKILSPEESEYHFSIGKVRVEQEGVAAFFGAFYTEVNQKPRDNDNESMENGDYISFDSGSHLELVEVPDNVDYSQGYTLVVDIGAGTTDLALFLDMEMVDNSRDTTNIGGNSVSSWANTAVKRRLGFSSENIPLMIDQCLVRDGKKFEPVEDEVTEAKNKYSTQMVNHLNIYFTGLGISLRNLSGLLVAGGGGKPSIRDGKEVSPAMSKVLVEQIKKYSPNIGELKTDVDLRELNIRGLMYMHKYDDDSAE